MPAPRGLVQKVDQELHRTGLLPRGGKLLVAVSGGADSVGLLRILMAVNGSDYWGWTLVVGHVDHGIRGAASREDAAFVQALAEQFGLHCEVREVQLGAGCSEDRARAYRYKALHKVAEEHECAGLVLGHHAEDQAETILMHMTRGCGVEGLRGMAAEQTLLRKPALKIWRPLLGVRRKELRDYLKALEQPWREDESNGSADYLRNRVRGELMPVLESLWPEGVEALGRLSEIAVETQEVVTTEADKVWAVRTDVEGAMVFPREALRAALPGVLSVVIRWAVYVVYGSSIYTSYERISEAVRLIKGREGGRQIQMGRSILVELEGDMVRISNGGVDRGPQEAVWWD